MKKTNDATNQVVIRFDSTALERIEKHVERLRRAAPGLAVTRAAAIRSLVLTALDTAEKPEKNTATS